MAFHPDVRRLRTREAVRSFLGLSEEWFEAASSFDPGKEGAEFEMEGPYILASSLELAAFVRHDIPKRNPNRGFRTVWAPARELKSTYKALARQLDLLFRAHIDGFPHPASFGFRVGRNIRENATQHAGHRFLLATDIENFFPSISKGQVEDLFRRIGCSDEAADAFARFVTIGEELPAGLPTSPVLSNAAVLPLDRDLAALAQGMGATYTRYADDLAFSSDTNLPSWEEISQTVEKHGFRLAETKTRRSRIGQAHFVTGLSISDPLRPHVPRRAKRGLRQVLYYAKKFGLDDHLSHRGYTHRATTQSAINHLDGMVKFISHHEPSLAQELKREWRDILLSSGHRASFSPRNQQASPFTIFVDEAEFERDGRMVLALAMAATQHPKVCSDEADLVLQSYLSDPFADGHYDVIEKKGLHFADATIGLRRAVVEAMRAMPFEGYVAYTECNDPEGYEQAYLKVLNAMLPRRLMAAESQVAHFVFEKNDKISREAIEATVMSAYSALAECNDRRPERLGVSYASKPHLGVALPDFLLGTLGKFLGSQPPKAGKPEAIERLMFETLRDKYRVIVDLSKGVEYSRRRPIESWC